jgi:hypothetical protein
MPGVRKHQKRSSSLEQWPSDFGQFVAWGRSLKFPNGRPSEGFRPLMAVFDGASRGEWSRMIEIHWTVYDVSMVNDQVLRK